MNTLGITAMLWFEEDEDASAMQTVKNAAKRYYSKYDHVPTLVELPPQWEQYADEIEEQLDGLRVSVSKMIQPRTVAVTHEK